MAQVILIATHNQGKIREYEELLGDLDLDWLVLSDAGVDFEVDETGDTFEENAILKAELYAAETGLLTLADDSGLVIDALGGAPGVLTARYGGSDLNSKERYELLLRNLADVPWEQRTSRFRCVIAVSNEQGVVGTAEGSCEGLIATTPAGEGGFGYDPVFYLPDLGKTMAQLSSDEKHQISHRGRALRGIEPVLRRLISLEGLSGRMGFLSD